MANANSKRNRSSVAAVAYYRMSSDKQDASIPEQRESVERYCKDNGYHIIRDYVDSGISGNATEKRHAFLQMHHDACNGRDFDAIVCWDQDRFGRFNSLEAGYYVHPLMKAGVYLVTVADGHIDWNGFSGRMMYTLKQEGKHQFLRDLSAGVLRGKLAAAKRGEQQGKVPLGYRRENKRLVFGDDHHMQLIRDIFAWYLAGDSLRTLAKRLNKLGEVNSEGMPWIPNTVANTLTNVAYIGTYKWNDRRQGDYNAIVDGKVTANTGGESTPDDWIVIPNNHPAIIDPGTFDAVQRRMSARQTHTTPHKNGGKFLLTRLLRCSKCGKPMTGQVTGGTNTVRYMCSNNRSNGNCDANTAKQAELVPCIIDAIVERFTDPKVVKRLRDVIRQKVKESTSKSNAATINKRLATVDAKITKAKRRLVEVDADMVPVVSDHIRDLAGRRDELKAALEVAKVPTSKRLLDETAKMDKAMQLFSRLKETLQRADAARLRELLAVIIDKVEVHSEKVMRGRRTVFELQGGVIHLRGDQLNNLSNLPRQA